MMIRKLMSAGFGLTMFAVAAMPMFGCVADTSDEEDTSIADEDISASAFATLLSRSKFQSMFPNRNSFYTYDGLVAATKKFGAFASTGDTKTRKREIAAFLANVFHETGGLVYKEEINKAPLCDTSWGPPGCSCAPGKQYFGRGPLQISWNGNYCAAGRALGRPLQSDPGLVARNATVAWETALWFWMTQSGAGARPAHNSITSGKGFGETIRSINGALECGGNNAAQMHDRVTKYKQFVQAMGVDVGPGSSDC